MTSKILRCRAVSLIGLWVNRIVPSVALYSEYLLPLRFAFRSSECVCVYILDPLRTDLSGFKRTPLLQKAEELESDRDDWSNRFGSVGSPRGSIR